MANLQEKIEIKERFNLFQYKTVDFTLRLNIYIREKREIKHQHWQIFDEGERLLLNISKCRAIIHVFRLIAQILPI